MLGVQRVGDHASGKLHAYANCACARGVCRAVLVASAGYITPRSAADHGHTPDPSPTAPAPPWTARWATAVAATGLAYSARPLCLSA